MSIQTVLSVGDPVKNRETSELNEFVAFLQLGPIRDTLETDRANLVIGLFAARVAAMRLSSGECIPESVSSNLPIASRR